jgi:hypothetical protein
MRGARGPILRSRLLYWLMCKASRMDPIYALRYE